MKKFFLFVMMNIVVHANYAQIMNTLKVHLGTNSDSFLLSDVDSITHDGSQYLCIYYDERVSYYSINDVDSMIIQPVTGFCYKIPEAQLNGWDEGFFYSDFYDNNNSFYLVSRYNSEDGTRTVYLDESSTNDFANSNALLLIFNSNYEINDIFISGYQFEAYPNEISITFLVYDKDGNAIDSFDVPYDDFYEAGVRTNYNARGLEHYRVMNTRDFLGKASKVIWKVADIGKKLEDGKYADILKDFLIGKLVGQVVKPFLGELTLTLSVDAYLKQLYENNKSWFMGSADIDIISIQRISKSTINVEGVISNISTIPSTRLMASENPNYINGKLAYLKEVPNNVMFGVAEGKSGQPGLYLNENCSTPVVISDSHFICSLPVDYKPGQTFYFRPFLVPSFQFEEGADMGQIFGKNVVSNIRYGIRKEYTDQNSVCITGEVISKTDKTAVISCSYTGVEGFECGVMISCDNETRKISAISSDGEQQISINELTPSTTYNYWAYIDIYGEPLNGVVKSFVTDASNKICPDENHPHWIDLGLPSGTLWQCCNDGASTPESYGSYYTFGNNSSAPTRSQIDELISNTTSQWTVLNGVYGTKFTSNNGGSIFLPAAGFRTWDNYNILHLDGTYGHYWSKTPYVGYSEGIWGWMMEFTPDGVCHHEGYGPGSNPVRPVQER